MDDTSKLMLETLVQMKEYNVKLIDAINNIVLEFQSSNDIAGINLFIPLTDGLKWILDACSLTGDMQEKLDINLDIQPIKDILPEMLEGVENKDYILVSDLLEFEVLPVLQDIQEQLGRIDD